MFVSARKAYSDIIFRLWTKLPFRKIELFIMITAAMGSLKITLKSITLKKASMVKCFKGNLLYCMYIY